MDKQQTINSNPSGRPKRCPVIDFGGINGLSIFAKGLFNSYTSLSYHLKR